MEIIISYNHYRVILIKDYRFNHKDIVEYLISKGADDFDFGLANACYGGQIEIVEFMISKGANNFDNGLFNACINGYKDIAELMISKGANSFHDGLWCACCYGHKEIGLLMIEKGANIDKYEMKSNYHHDNLLNFNDIYYLLQRGVTKFGKYTNIANNCKEWKIEFQTTANELFIKDIANLLIEF